MLSSLDRGVAETRNDRHSEEAAPALREKFALDNELSLGCNHTQVE